MDGSFIPPPFPFPEAWPRVFAEQQHERRWLTPTTFAAGQMTTEYNYPVDPSIHAEVTVDGQDGDIEEEEEDEYEYGYVLSDEWRERFQSSVQLQQLQQQQKPKSKKKKPQHKKKVKQQRQVNTEAVAAAHASRSGHLQREIQAAKTRELARKWKRRNGVDTSTPQVEALETSLNMLFDEFCDTFQPVVWPHDPLQR